MYTDTEKIQEEIPIKSIHQPREFQLDCICQAIRAHP